MIDTVVIGAGPYGLSVAAHLKARGVRFRIFGRAMDSWISHMPAGMLLKSDGFASNLSDPSGGYSLQQFCSEKGLPYHDKGHPVSREVFAGYGLAFRDRKVPEVEDKTITSIEPENDGFVVGVDDGETFHTRRVVLAIGVTHFGYIPESVANLPAQYLSHSGQHSDVGRFRGQTVLILGAGSSALDLAGLMHEAGMDVQLIARKPLKFHSKSDEPGPCGIRCGGPHLDWGRVGSLSSLRTIRTCSTIFPKDFGLN